MKHYNFIVTGSLTARVEARSPQEADDVLEEWLSENSPVRDWETYDEGEGKDKFDVIDIEVTQKQMDQEVCCECGDRVNQGSGKFVNRVSVLDNYSERKENGRPYPQGAWVCAECDEKR